MEKISLSLKITDKNNTDEIHIDDFEAKDIAEYWRLWLLNIYQKVLEKPDVK